MLDEVQKAPGGRMAGRAVRNIASKHRWAVSGTPMELGRSSDISDLINFVAGASSPAYIDWTAGLEGMRKHELGAKVRALDALRPLILRRMKATLISTLRIGRTLPPICKTFDLTPQEQALQSEFVLFNCLREYNKGVGKAAGGFGSGEEGFGAAQQMLLAETIQRSILSPQLFAEWGAKVLRANKKRSHAYSQTVVGRHAMVTGDLAMRRAAAAQQKTTAESIVGDLVRHDLSSLSWNPLVGAGQSELRKATSSLRQLVHAHLSREYRDSDGS